MGKETKIGWCDSSINLMMGCDGCELWTKKVRTCYAGTLTERWGGRKGWPESFNKPAIFMNRLDKALSWPDLTGKERPAKPWLNGLPRIVFLNDMGDTFTESLPVDWLAPALPRMADSPHQWLILTKRPKRMRDFFDRYECPSNVWAGVSLTSVSNYDRVRTLLEVRSGLKYISYEPALEYVNIPYNLHYDDVWMRMNMSRLAGFSDSIKWLIMGAESGPQARISKEEWFLSSLRRAKEFGVKVFVKQLGSVWAEDNLANPKADSKAEEWLHWPVDLRVREMPI